MTPSLSYGPFISRAQAKAQGLKHYYTGICAHGHQGRRLVSDKRCNICSSIAATARNKKKADSDPAFRAKRIEEAAAWRKSNPKARSAIRRRYEKTERGHAAKSLRTLIRETLKAHSAGKQSKSASLLGCSPLEAAQYLEALFLPGMTWDNHGKWHIDHIRPVASFDNPADPACWHYTNLQPLWAADNLAKSDKWEPMAA